MLGRIALFYPLDNSNRITQQFISALDLKAFQMYVFFERIGDSALSSFCGSKNIPFFNLNSKFVLFRNIEILRLVKQNKIDLVVINSYPLSPYVIFLRIFSGETKIIYVRHHNRMHHIKRNLRAQIIDSLTHKFAHHIIAVSNEVKRTLIKEKCPDSKISVVHHGIDCKLISQRKPKKMSFSEQRKVKLIMVGRIAWEKDYGTAIDVVHELENNGIICELSILGSGINRVTDEVTNLAKIKLKCSKVIFLGWEADVHKFLEKNDIFLHTSLDEAFGLSVLEAYLNAIPVVAISNGAVREIQECVGDRVIATKSEVPSAIIVILDNYWQASKRAIEMSKVARNIFDVKICANKYSEIFASVILGKSK